MVMMMYDDDECSVFARERRPPCNSASRPVHVRSLDARAPWVCVLPQKTEGTALASHRAEMVKHFAARWKSQRPLPPSSAGLARYAPRPSRGMP
eukprot:2226692-Rhodomonas_salina.1